MSEMAENQIEVNATISTVTTVEYKDEEKKIEMIIRTEQNEELSSPPPEEPLPSQPAVQSVVTPPVVSPLASEIDVKAQGTKRTRARKSRSNSSASTATDDGDGDAEDEEEDDDYEVAARARKSKRPKPSTPTEKITNGPVASTPKRKNGEKGPRPSTPERRIPVDMEFPTTPVREKKSRNISDEEYMAALQVLRDRKASFDSASKDNRRAIIAACGREISVASLRKKAKEWDLSWEVAKKDSPKKKKN